MLTLYATFPSRATRCLWALAEANVVEYQVVTLEDPKSRTTPEYLALNPLGKVPTLVAGDEIVHETIAILEYVARSHPKARLTPIKATDFVKYLQWISYCLTEIEAPLWMQFKHTANSDTGNGHIGFLPEELRVPEVLKSCTWEISRSLGPVEDYLSSGREFLVGDHFTNADIILGSLLSSIRDHTSIKIGASCSRYQHSMVSRPAYRQAVARATAAQQKT